jgi:hypothetical protein
MSFPERGISWGYILGMDGLRQQRDEKSPLAQMPHRYRNRGQVARDALLT